MLLCVAMPLNDLKRHRMMYVSIIIIIILGIIVLFAAVGAGNQV